MSDKKKRRKFNKLVRDNIPKKITDGGEVAVTKTVKDEDFRKLLIEKLTQEIEEYSAATTVAKKLDNLADILEILYALSDLDDIAFTDVEIERKQKEQSRGKFDDRVFLIETYKK